jgi:hypothetical protein
MTHTEERNYWNDARVRALDESAHFEIVSEGRGRATIRMSEDIVEIAIENSARPEDWDGELDVAMKYEVCGLCEGCGTHVNPSIDCCGLTREDFDEDPDFAEDYMSGAYDVPCNRCGGKRVVPHVELPGDIAKIVTERERSLADYRACERMERMYGA